MLHLMLANGPEAFACGEIYAWFRPWRLNHFRTRCACGDLACPVWKRLSATTEETFHRDVMAILEVDFVVDSSKRINWVVDSNRWALEAGIAVHNVIIWKEPHDLAYSYWRRGRYEDWRPVFLRYYREVLDAGLPILPVCYSDLVRSPASELRRICEAIGIPYWPGCEEFWAGEHHHLFGSGGVRKQVRAGESRIAPAEFPPEFIRCHEQSNWREDAGLSALIHELRTPSGA